jgi:hypothetical protein
MRDPERIDKILKEISRIWKKYPDLRFGQLLENIFGCERNDNRCIFHIEDDIILVRLENFENFIGYK